MAKAGNWNTNRMYDIRQSVLGSNERLGTNCGEEDSGPFIIMSSGVRQPPTHPFMDDMTMTTKSVVEGRWTLEELGQIMRWAVVNEIQTNKV